MITDGKDLTLPSYTRFDASANYALSDDMSLGIHLENLTDELYFPHAHSTHQASVGSPLSQQESHCLDSYNLKIIFNF